MSKKKREAESLGATAGSNHRFAGIFGTLIIVVLIVLVFGFFAIRTRTAKQWLESHFSERIGVPVSIERSSIDLPYDLVIDGLKSATGDEEPTFSVEQLRLGFTRRLGLRLELRKVELVMRRTEAGDWKPSSFSKLGPLQDIEEISAATDSFEKKYLLRVTDSNVLWEDEHRRKLASATGIRFSMMPVELPARALTHYSLYIRRADGGGGYMLRGVEREWLATEDNTYMELMRRENQPGSGEGDDPANGERDSEPTGVPDDPQEGDAL